MPSPSAHDEDHRALGRIEDRFRGLPEDQRLTRAACDTHYDEIVTAQSRFAQDCIFRCDADARIRLAAYLMLFGEIGRFLQDGVLVEPQ